MSASDDLTIEVAGERDLPDLMHALNALAQDLADPFRASQQAVARALFAPDAFAMALLARRGGETLGAVLAAPLFSTMWGASLVYVSDLWVAPAARRQALGRRLLAATAREGARRWDARALKLNVYTDNARALAFYRRLGFAVQENERSAILDDAGVAALGDGA